MRSGKHSIPDGALCGNGDLSAVLGSFKKGLRIYIAKCDLWLANERRNEGGGIKPLCTVDFDIPKELYKNYYVEQRMDEGEIFCRFSHKDNFIEIKIIVCAVKNDIFLTVKASNVSLISTPKLTAFSCNADSLENFSQDGILGFTRVFDNETLAFACKVTAGLKSFGDSEYVFSASTNFDSDTFDSDVKSHLSAFDESAYLSELSQHAEWWKNFYSQSSFEVSDKELEMNWYASQYHLAICTRNKKFPPGIYGNFITIENVNWSGDYHLNYNYEAPFYAVCNSNHVELCDGYFTPLEEFIPRGKKCAREYLGCGGVYYPVGIMPKGLFSEYAVPPQTHEKMFLGQKSNAAYAAVICVMRWYSTRDTEFAKEHLYPFLKEVGAFWEDYLIEENGRYVICDDAVHEVPYYKDSFNPKKYKKEIHCKNNLISLGLVQMVFHTLLDMAIALEVDEEKYGTWRDITERISPYPTFYKHFRRVFRYSEKGMAWNDSNFLCLQHIYPVGQWGNSGKDVLLKTAKNTFFINNRWFDGNATNSVFPCAVRLGVNPVLILKQLRLNYKKIQLSNMLMLHGGGCLENCSLTASTLNEMVMQSYEGVLKIFPNWDKTLDCKFNDLRAYGAFLVSSEMQNGRIKHVRIFSEAGEPLKLENPFEKCRIISDSELTSSEKLITMKTHKNQVIEILPLE